MKVGPTSWQRRPIREILPTEKKVSFYVDEAFHARFRINLKYDDLAQSRFFKICMEAYESRDPEFMSFIYKKIEDKINKRKKKKIKKDNIEKKQIIENFALNEDEIKDIFDIIATENPDL